MCPPPPPQHKNANHILIVDDNAAIHEDFKRILMDKSNADDFSAEDAAFFGTSDTTNETHHSFELEFALQGQEALEKVMTAIRNGNRFAGVFMDVRMPPGWDGIETAKRLWEEDPDLQIVICTAYSDYSWNDMVEQLGKTDKLLILRKPFDVIEAEQAAHAFSKKWSLLQDSRRHAVFLEQTMDLSPLMIFWISENGEITYANQSACQALQSNSSQVCTLKASDIFTSWSGETWKDIWNKSLLRKGTKQETFITSHEGGSIPVEAIITVLDFQEKRVMCVTAQDICERLETLRELASARDAALQSARMKSQFLANMSHEIRTPMNGVLGMAELLGKTELSTIQREYVGIINQSGGALLSIINDILDSAKIESGKIEFQNINFNLNELIRGTMHTVSANAEKKGIKLWSHIDPEIPPMLCGDPGRLRQVLLNLVGNAVKFTANGEVSLTIELIPNNDKECRLRFSVKDSGIGINPEQLKQIFHPFTQADNTNKRSYGGTGLGLTISSQIVQAMGGSIQVSSKESQGSEFWFTIQLQKASGTAITNHTQRPKSTRHVAPPAPTDSESFGKHINSPLKILLAEDNAVNRKVTLMQLEQIGYAADVVENGEEALNAMDAKAYDVILMDCQMPIMDGYETTRHIRQRFRRRVHIIALTANAMKEDRQRCISAGMDDYLSKPLNSNSLAEALNAIHSGRTIRKNAPKRGVSQMPSIPENEIAVDIKRLHEVTGDNEELFREISQQYLDQAEEILTEMDKAIHTGNHDNICKLAHKLAGSSATCGMIAIVDPLRSLESLNSNQISEALLLHQQAIHQLSRIREFLTQPNQEP